MSRRVVVSGLGPVSGIGIGIEPTWQAAVDGRSAVDRITAFDASGFPCCIGAEVRDFRVNRFVPKTYRKATKVMARDIELAVAAADQAARDAKLITKGTATDGQSTTYDGARMGCHIGAGLVAANLNELTSALATSRDDGGAFDIRKWGREGMNNLYPLWLLKYLPNMLACHVTIIHDTQGPSNTITCADTSATLSIGESFRVIQRGTADACFCGGVDCKLNPMAFFRQLLANQLTTESNSEPHQAVRPLCRSASGTAIGEGGGILILEAHETYMKRAAAIGNMCAYAELVGFGASQTLHPASRNLLPDPKGEGIALAIGSALREAGVDPTEIDLIVPFALALAASDQAEANALRQVFGDALPRIPVRPIKSMTGNCCAGAGALDTAMGACSLARQTLPAVINCDQPLDGLNVSTTPSRAANLRYALIVGTGMGGQNAALVLKRFEN